jgi:hypothetical protein
MNNQLANLFHQKSHFIAQRMGDEIMLVELKDEVVDFNRYLTLNEVGAFIWDELEENESLDSLANKVIAAFDVTKEAVLEDLKIFIPLLVGFVLKKN